MKKVIIPQILVCVTKQKTCERLIKFGANIAKETNGDLHVLHITDKIYEVSNRIDFLFKKSCDNNADMNILVSADIAVNLEEFIIKNGINIVILGKPNYNIKRNEESNLLKTINSNTNGIEVFIVPILEDLYFESVI